MQGSMLTAAIVFAAITHLCNAYKYGKDACEPGKSL